MTDQYGIIFPGQGSQSLGMLADIADEYSVIKDTFSEASQVLGYDLWAFCQKGPEEQLNQTQVTQPALLTADVAIWRLLNETGISAPVCAAGHSLGEYSALVASGALAFAEAVQLVAERGNLMQRAVPSGEGGMAAVIGLPDEDVAGLCQQIAGDNEVLQPANFNAPGQVVVAGHQTAITRLADQGKAYGAKMVKPLPVSVPAHCSLMEPAQSQFQASLNLVEFTASSFPILHNVDAEQHQPDEIRSVMARQLTSPVRWVDTIHNMQAMGAEMFIECGPGQVLSGLNKRIDRQIVTYNTANIEQLANVMNAMETLT